MVRNCVVVGCHNLHHPMKKIPFHSFPFKRPDVLDRWINAVRREDWYPSRTSCICGIHFLESDYQIRPGLSLKLLKLDAVPSVFPSYPMHLQQVGSSRRILKRHLAAEDVNHDVAETMEVDQEEITITPENKTDDKECQTVVTMCNADQFIYTYKRKIKTLQQKVRRRDKKITCMKDLVKRLQENGSSTENLETVLQSYFDGFPLELLTHEKKYSAVPVTQRRYTDIMKQFAHTLYFYSPKAYHFVRQHFTLPNVRTLRKWLCKMNGQPGFLQEVFNFLKEMIQNQPYVRESCLIFDSMAIRKQVIWDQTEGRFVGNIDYGGIINDDCAEPASEALFFQIVSYVGNFKCPVAYFLVNKCDANLQTQIVMSCLKMLDEVGINIRSITCDGTATNISTFKKLGCSLVSGNITSHFQHPNKKYKVYCMLDSCHMLKLARNALAEKKICSHSGLVNWNYLKQLDTLQENLKLKFANSLSSNHIYYKNKIMNVRLAAQTISSGVADALQFLKSQEVPDFVNCDATIQFIRIIDRLFDILNSRNPFGKGFKSPIRPKTVNYFSEVFEETTNYLKSLTIDEVPLLQHNKKTFALGFILTMQSTLGLAKDLFNLPNNPSQYLLTYKCSQDHLELFFSCIRSRGGWNNNPNCQQLRWSLRQLLYKNSVKSSVNANCIDFGSLCSPIMEFRSDKICIIDNHTSSNDDSDDFSNFLIDVNVNLNALQENILYYISSFVVRKLANSIHCDACVNILFNTTSKQDHTYSADLESYKQFNIYVNRGGLISASDIVYQIIHFVEKVFRTLEARNDLSINIKLKLQNAAVNHFGKNLGLFQPTHPVSGEFIIEDLHELQLVKAIVNIFLKCRMHHHAKSINLKLHGKEASVRQKMTKLILFKNC